MPQRVGTTSAAAQRAALIRDQQNVETSSSLSGRLVPIVMM
jgi:hypothetical protein